VYHSNDLLCADIGVPSSEIPNSQNPVDGTLVHGFFSIFDKYNSLPCLYVYEIMSHHSNDDIIEAYKKASVKHNERSFSAVKSKYNPETRILYVGKVQKDIGARQIVHFGLYKQPKTGGLQMLYWAKELQLKLRIHVYAFEDLNMRDYLVPFENRLARELQPLIGKHK
jgi:hypothetical protein